MAKPEHEEIIEKMYGYSQRSCGRLCLFVTEVSIAAGKFPDTFKLAIITYEQLLEDIFSQKF